MMKADEAKWFALFLFGMALLGAERGWSAVAWNVGAGIVGWCVGHVLRERNK